MPSKLKTGCTGKQRTGWIAVGYSKADDFWYSSEGVFSSPEIAIRDLKANYLVDMWSAQKVSLIKAYCERE